MWWWQRKYELTKGKDGSVFHVLDQWQNSFNSVIYAVWVWPNFGLYRWAFIVQVLDCKIRDSWDCFGSLVAKTPRFHCKRYEFNPWSGSQDPTCCAVWPKIKRVTKRKPFVGLRKEVPVWQLWGNCFSQSSKHISPDTCPWLFNQMLI